MKLKNEIPPLSPFLVEPLLRSALREDLGQAGDITSNAIFSCKDNSRAFIVTREAGIVAGLDVAEQTFSMLDNTVKCEQLLSDGSSVNAGQKTMMVVGPTRSILMAERVALNFVMLMSGIATHTYRMVEAISTSSASIICTRKTLPGLRLVQKHAVRLGGGLNHRFGLNDAILIKDNHIKAAGGVVAALKRAQTLSSPMHLLEVEVDGLDQLQQLLQFQGVHAVLLDNFEPKDLAKAVELVDGRIITEASGGVTHANVCEIAKTGVDYISSGELTHSFRQLDLGLDFA